MSFDYLSAKSAAALGSVCPLNNKLQVEVSIAYQQKSAAAVISVCSKNTKLFAASPAALKYVCVLSSVGQ